MLIICLPYSWTRPDDECLYAAAQWPARYTTVLLFRGRHAVAIMQRRSGGAQRPAYIVVMYYCRSMQAVPQAFPVSTANVDRAE